MTSGSSGFGVKKKKGVATSVSVRGRYHLQGQPPTVAKKLPLDVVDEFEGMTIYIYIFYLGGDVLIRPCSVKKKKEPCFTCIVHDPTY